MHFTVGDDLSGISSYRATLNGQWILAAYDPKEDHIRIEPLNEKMPIRGTLALTVKDRVGNVNVFSVNL